MGNRSTSSHPGSRTIMPDPEASARQAGLRYVSDDDPGLRRKKWGRGFTYLDPANNHVQDDAVRERIERLAIPPAWTDVWICRHADGHLQATGRDDEGRKQYIYHPDWQEVRSRAKFDRLIPFGEALPQIRARCAEDLHRDGLPREKVLAAAVHLLDHTLIRIGNTQYAQDNGSYGLTTLRNRHISFSEDGCTFEFTGKSGKELCIELHDPSLARVLKQLHDVTGYELFQYIDDGQHRHTVNAGDVNDYLQQSAERPITAKDFRTWGGTVEAAAALARHGAFETKQEAQKNVARAVEDVADRLGNTTSVCRAHYIHPALLDAYQAGHWLPSWTERIQETPDPHFTPEEHATLCILRMLRNNQ